MLSAALTLLLALPLVMLPLLRLEYPVVNGLVHASGADERWSVKLLSPLLLLAALSLPPFFAPDSFSNQLLDILPRNNLSLVIAIALASALSVAIASAVHEWTCVPYAITGAVLGAQLMVGGHIDWIYAGGVLASWIVAPLLCMGVSALLTRLFMLMTTKSGKHLAMVDHRFLLGCMVGSVLLVAAGGWNNAQLFSLFPRLILEDMPLALGLTMGFMVLFLALSGAYLSRRADYMAGTALDFGTAYVLSVMLSMAAVFALFSVPALKITGLMPTPLSANSLLVAALVGCALVRGKATLSAETIRKSAASTFIAPVISILTSYCLCMILEVNEGAGWSASLLPSLILLVLIVVAAALYAYMRHVSAVKRRRKMLLAREEQVYSTQKSLSALEARVETNEKELLNKLEIKRKELVDFAVGVSEQKAFMETVSEDLSRARALPAGPQKDAALEEIQSRLRERMYFTREMNDFYARSEVLHRDFNMRLKEAYPQLTESERKLANLLRQGFSSKYIASLMNITPKSVEISRYRLRIKLGLSRSDNLVQFIKSI